MGLIIPTYETKSGLNLTNAYLGLTTVWFDHNDSRLSFKLDIYLNRQAYENRKEPVESTGINGDLYVENIGGMDVNGMIDGILIEKIAAINSHTDAECQAHNNELVAIGNANYWLEAWQPELRVFSAAYIPEE